jgi:hypothetical protein
MLRCGSDQSRTIIIYYFIFAVTDNNKDSANSATCGKILVVPFDGVKFDADSGGTMVTGCNGGSGGKHRSDLSGRDISTSIAAGNVRKGTVDVSGRVIGNECPGQEFANGGRTQDKERKP